MFLVTTRNPSTAFTLRGKGERSAPCLSCSFRGAPAPRPPSSESGPARPLPAASHRTCKYLRAARLSGSGKVSQNRSMFGHEETWVGLGWQRWTKRKELRKAARQLPSGGRRRNAGLTLESVPRPALGRVSHLHVAAGCWHETFPGLLLAQHGLPTLPHPSFSDSS